MRNNGFSIIELVVVVIIIGILAVVSLSTLQNPRERGYGKNAEFNLLAIYAAQKRYLLSENKYFFCNALTAPADKVFEITKALPIKIDDGNFNYDIAAYGTTGFRAIATRKDGKCANKQMNLTSDNSTVDKRGCALW